MSFIDLPKEYPKTTSLRPALVQCVADLFTQHNADKDLRDARDAGNIKFYTNPAKFAAAHYANGNSSALTKLFGDAFMHVEAIPSAEAGIAFVSACIDETINIALNGLGIGGTYRETEQEAKNYAEKIACLCKNQPTECWSDVPTEEFWPQHLIPGCDSNTQPDEL